jgi:hypothetical protein
MGIFDKIFGKKSKDSEVKDIGIEKGEVKKKSSDEITDVLKRRKGELKKSITREKPQKMAAYSALEVPFRPHQCPNCKNHSREIKRCAAFTLPTPPVGELLAMFSGESQEDCAGFEPFPKLNVKKIEESKDVQGLMKALQHEDDSIWSKASGALIEIGEHAVEPLILALKDVNPRVRWIAASDLGAIGDARAVEPLIKAITTDPERDVRWHAVDALGEIGDVRAIGPLTQSLKDEDSYVLEAARGALEKINAKKR